MSKPTVKRNYTKIPNTLFSPLRLTPYERLVVMYILKFDKCFAGQATIAKDLSMSRSSVQRAITTLLDKNVIRKTARQGWSVFYSVNKRNEWKLKGENQ